MYKSPVKTDRRAGVLLHPSSLPGEFSFGDIGHQAYRFIEFLNRIGMKVWQVLPLGVTHADRSPYQCLSTHAGNPLLISLDWLMDRGWLSRDEVEASSKDDHSRLRCLFSAGDTFYATADQQWKSRLDAFIDKHNGWLSDFALFIAGKEKFNDAPWYSWPADIRHREKKALDKLANEKSKLIRQVYFEQFVFFTQWHEVKQYAHKHGIELFGDLPIFVARDSADVWAERQNFLIDDDGEMEVVAGVPPDAFSETGQRWGNPLYDWDYMQRNQFGWWKQRFETQLELFDLVRIDHFRGLQACWYIPGDDDTAINGRWVEVPGKELLETLFNTFDDMPLIAEDLGVITDEVIALKDQFQLPGMKVLQFAFDGNTANPHLPHLHKAVDVIYTGTHDNDTSLSWAAQTQNYNSDFFLQYLNCSAENKVERVKALLRSAMSSVSFLAMIPLQDVFMLGGDARMNVPGTTENNWCWRFSWDQEDHEITDFISQLLKLYQR